MVVEFKAIEAIDSLVALLRVAEDSAVHCWEQDEAFHPGIFPGLILLARFAAERAGEEFKQAVVAAEVSRWNKNLQGERDELQQKILQVAAERDELRAQLAKVRAQPTEVRAQMAELSENPGELPAEPAPKPYQWKVGDVVEHDDGSLSCTRRVNDRAEGWVFLEGVESGLPQPEWERRGWKLFRKSNASDSTGTDGEGQS